MQKNTSHKTKVNELSGILNEKFGKMVLQSIKQGLGLCQWLFLPYVTFRAQAHTLFGLRLCAVSGSLFYLVVLNLYESPNEI